MGTSIESKGRGGARPGAGRKPRDTPKATLSVQVEPDDLDRFREICQSRKKSQAQQITEWIKRARL